MQARPAGLVCASIEIEPEPFQPRHDRGAHAPVVLADAAGEGDGVGAFHRGDHRTGMARGPVAEMLDCEACLVRAGGMQGAHVGHAAEAEQTAATIEQVGGAVDAVILRQAQHRIAVDGAGARAHGQPVERRVAHGGGDRLAVADGAEAGAVAEMQRQDALWQRLARKVRQRADEARVGNAVKAVAADAFRVLLRRQCIAQCHVRIGGVEGGVEGGILRKARRRFGQRADGGEVVRIVERRQRHAGLDFGDDVGGEAARFQQCAPAMDDAVASRRQASGRNAAVFERGEDMAEGVGMIAHHDGAAFAIERKNRRAADLARHAGKQALEISVEQHDLDRRRAGIDDENGGHGRLPSPISSL